MSDRREFTITKVERSPEGYWTARVTAGGTSLNVDRRYGAWHAVVGASRREVLPEVARALQDRVRPLEKAMRRGPGDEARQAEGAAAER